MSTWSAASKSSSTSDGAEAAGGTPVLAAPISARLAAVGAAALDTRVVRAALIVHPFPSFLDGAVVALVALVAGGVPMTALALGASMTVVQFAIGTLNDVLDAPKDAVSHPSKPIPAGLVSVDAGWILAGLLAMVGVIFASMAGPAAVGLALAALAIGAWYDLVAKGTTLSWLPLAVGIPLLPVFGWWGATGSLPGIFLVIIPAAANAGTALAISNAVVERERDLASGTGSIAVTLGAGRASFLALVLHVVVLLLAVATAVSLGAPTGWVATVVAASVVPLGGAVLGVVAALRPGSGLRELAWEIEAVGTGLLAVAWLGALSASRGLPIPG